MAAQNIDQFVAKRPRINYVGKDCELLKALREKLSSKQEQLMNLMANQSNFTGDIADRSGPSAGPQILPNDVKPEGGLGEKSVCRVLICDPDIREFAEVVVAELIEEQIHSSIQLLAPGVSVSAILVDVSRSCPAAIVIDEENVLTASLSIAVFQEEPQERRNVPVEEGISFLISFFKRHPSLRNGLEVKSILKRKAPFDPYPIVSSSSSSLTNTPPASRLISESPKAVGSSIPGGPASKPAFAIPDNEMCQMLDDLKEGRFLTLRQLDMIVACVQKRRRETIGGEDDSVQSLNETGERGSNKSNNTAPMLSALPKLVDKLRSVGMALNGGSPKTASQSSSVSNMGSSNANVMPGPSMNKTLLPSPTTSVADKVREAAPSVKNPSMATRHFSEAFSGSSNIGLSSNETKVSNNSVNDHHNGSQMSTPFSAFDKHMTLSSEELHYNTSTRLQNNNANNLQGIGVNKNASDMTSKTNFNSSVSPVKQRTRFEQNIVPPKAPSLLNMDFSSYNVESSEQSSRSTSNSSIPTYSNPHEQPHDKSLDDKDFRASSIIKSQSSNFINFLRSKPQQQRMPAPGEREESSTMPGPRVPQIHAESAPRMPSASGPRMPLLHAGASVPRNPAQYNDAAVPTMPVQHANAPRSPLEQTHAAVSRLSAEHDCVARQRMPVGYDGAPRFPVEPTAPGMPARHVTPDQRMPVEHGNGFPGSRMPVGGGRPPLISGFPGEGGSFSIRPAPPARQGPLMPDPGFTRPGMRPAGSSGGLNPRFSGILDQGPPQGLMGHPNATRPVSSSFQNSMRYIEEW